MFNLNVSILNIKKYLSYLYPIRIKKITTDYHTLELTWHNGKLMLDSAFANYSFGNLHKVFQLAFEQSNLNVPSTGHVLLLGLGGGSVVEILEKEYGFNGVVTAIEIDKEVISLYNTVFSTNHTSLVNIIQEDAFNWVSKGDHEVRYDLIICDIFIDLEVPAFMKEISFYQKLKGMLKSGSSIYVNTIFRNGKKEIDTSLFYPTFKQIEKYEFFDLNAVFVLKTP